ncbi:MAG: TIGR00282 family metallophosphoesterase [Firmicutes bacterium]|jgi:metallophosphoesterase (TIGR00282 family)|nr:TIGR00282 family metallophosphoesterase [Bacillota bacterium]MDH7496517.1 TIGR00282 family metallophosphoesterase [Bacillota bacterium]
MMLRILFIGDIVGKPGRRACQTLLPEIVQRLRADAVIANGENAAGGFGLTADTSKEILGCGVHVITTGNHVWNKREFYQVLAASERVLRPANYPPGAPGRGAAVFQVAGGVRLCVVNLAGRVFMAPVDCPFRTVDRILEELSPSCDLFVVDFHAEATSEKVALGWYLDGRVASVVGTHTHVQTADERILPGGTAYITDLGMTGPVDSVIGVRTDIIVQRFLSGLPAKFETASGRAQVSGALVTVDTGTGKAKDIERVLVAENE